MYMYICISIYILICIPICVHILDSYVYLCKHSLSNLWCRFPKCFKTSNLKFVCLLGLSHSCFSVLFLPIFILACSVRSAPLAGPLWAVAVLLVLLLGGSTWRPPASSASCESIESGWGHCAGCLSYLPRSRIPKILLCDRILLSRGKLGLKPPVENVKFTVHLSEPPP